MSNPITIVLATGNTGKVKELQSYFTEMPLRLEPQSNWSIPSPPETGTTFVENAIIKARHAAEKTGMPALADDSGLVIPALKGDPGVYSARYGGEGLTDAERVDCVLQALDKAESKDRSAFFCCALAFFKHAKDPLPLLATAQWHGTITTEAHGQGGFGYDPLFYVQEFGRTAAEIDIDIKNKISHRGQAMESFLQGLSSYFLDETLMVETP